ncbi:MAG: hypothetical protein DBX59_03640 [Bacillota bacterium]|nr:MAG: hypothetical protein DBX59_03640 [Bacillota bacterium]
MKRTLALQKWQLKDLETGVIVPAAVPNDITVDLYRAGVIENPMFGMNHCEVNRFLTHDFEYSVRFDVAEDMLSAEELYLNFDGIDLYAEIRLNGAELGKTENMFLNYRYEVKSLLKAKDNELFVTMRSTLEKMKEIDCEGYFGVFNVPRLFMRKAQCHFGWDWAPDMSGYGMWGAAYLTAENKYRIDDVHYTADNAGNVTVFTELNYNIRATADFYGNPIDGTASKRANDTLKIYLEKTPDSDEYFVLERPVTGKKNFVNFKMETPRLWWPTGYGEQPLYRYKVQLYRNGKLMDEREGRLAFREVKLVQEPKSADTLGYELEINGVRIFAKGANWVPVSCFTGAIEDEKYEQLVSLAKNGNINMLRVWGGGIYEKDIFYNLCDELGLMVWQDFMFACADIPDDNAAWMENTLKECEYQIRRLRNHPSLVYWCGGNEKTGSYALQITHGDYFIDNVLHGLVKTLDPSRPFARQSPCSFTDVGNDMTSGESHANSLEPCIEAGIENYRSLMAEKVVSFASECAVLGPDTIESLRRYMPEDKLWPLNDNWRDRLMDNPYAAIRMDFLDRELLYMSRLYKEPQTLEQFVKRGMTVHAEIVRAEYEYARSHKGECGGILGWMYSDIWPTGSWAIVNYYTEPKQAYYAMKRSFAPLLFTFVQNKEGGTDFVAVNDALSAVEFSADVGWSDADGVREPLKNISAEIGENGVYRVSLGKIEPDSRRYLYAEAKAGGKSYSTVYSPLFWKDFPFVSDYEKSLAQISGDTVEISVTAHKFLKNLFISADNNETVIYSDNYLDVEAGKTVKVTAYRAGGLKAEELKFTDFAAVSE